MGKVFKLKTEEEVLEQILFELIVLAAGVPDEDKQASAASICSLSKLPTDVTNILIMSATEVQYEVWKTMYASALVENDNIELAEKLNDAAKELLG